LAHSSQFTPPCESHVFVGDGIRESKIAVFAEAPPLLAPPRSVPYAPETRWFLTRHYGTAQQRKEKAQARQREKDARQQEK
jgi:hypothetical protein